MGTFARRAAPVQVTYIGYQNTTGMAAMDYRLTDAYADPPGTTDAYYTEKLVRLPVTFFCYRPSSDAPEVSPSPQLAGGHVTFGSFNNVSKITPQVLQVWGTILASLDESRLIMMGDMTDSLRARVTSHFAGHGVEAGRIELVNRVPRASYLELINRVDIALDPFPFIGHTTTCDSLWQGVPVVSLVGNTYVSRFGCSGLVALGLESLVAESPEQYVELALALARDTSRLQGLRGSLRDRMAASPLLDFVGFTRNLELEYRRMWSTWCAGGR
jgi:predicted O-linked N-acetylglucosamine transferase (SPINDLY family)